MLGSERNPLVENLSLYLLDPQLTPLELRDQATHMLHFAEHCEAIAPDRVLETFVESDSDYQLAKKRLLSEPL